MKDILQDHSTTSLVVAIEENMFALFPLMDKWTQATTYDGPEVKWALTNIQSPMMNSVMSARLSSGQADVTIRSIIAEAKKRNVPMMWWTGPASQPADLGERLEKHGFIDAGQSPGMAVGLTKIMDDQPTPAGLTVRLVEGKEDLKHWCQVFEAGFEMPDFVGEAYYDFLRHVDTDAAMMIYLGLLNDKPVAISQLVFGAGVAGVYSVATIPKARRQGIGAVMTLIPLLEAKKQGYKIGILHASEMGINLYRSLGFQEYCKIGFYIWSPEQQ